MLNGILKFHTRVLLMWGLLIVFTILLMAVCHESIVANAFVITDKENLVSQEFFTFRGNSKYNGSTIGSHIEASDFANLELTDSGGTHTDGDGSTVYSNYVIFKINLLFDQHTKSIGDTGCKVIKDSCDWNDMDKANGYKYGDAETDTEQYIAYGAVCAIRTNGDNSTKKYTPMFSKGNTTIAEQIFNVDGDYSIYVFFQTQKGHDTQKHILKWSFKVRTEIYLIDKETSMSIKDSGISSKSVIVDFANRNETLSQISQKVQVDCMRINCKTNESQRLDISDGFELEAKIGTSDKYHFVVWANGFISETFDFSIDTYRIEDRVLFANLRKQIGQNRYEAEGYFYIISESSSNNPIEIQIDYYDVEAPVIYDEDGNAVPTILTTNYLSGTLIDKIGLYRVWAKSLTLNEIWWIEIVPHDNPSYNYGVLSANRFNNFKTKWYQVYDRINGRYLCFDMKEWKRAYDAAMTIENSLVNNQTGRPYYNGKYYSDTVDVTTAMNEYVFAHNFKTVYYDPNDFSDTDESIRTFSSAAFDRTIYLNDEFQFVKQHGAEVESVVAISEEGREYKIKFFVPIAEQNIPHGKYTIIETDFYGNETRYIVYRDKNAPIVTVHLNGQNTTVDQGQSLSANGSFAIYDFNDDFDPFAVLKITAPDGNVSYYYQDEYKGIAFIKEGRYTIETYDRNNNVAKFFVTVE